MSIDARRLRRAIVPLLAGTAIVLSLASGAGAVGRYTDSKGDAGQAPDITGVSVASDPNGQIAFTISVVNLPSPADVRTFIFLDTDLNGSTGAPDTEGADYMFAVDESDDSYSFARWNGTDWDGEIPYSTVKVSSHSSGVVISVNRSELGGTEGFNFWTRTRLGDPSARQEDTAPELGVWNYSLQAAGPDIKGVMVQTKPGFGPRAGKPFTLTPVALKDAAAEQQGVSVLPRPESYTCRARLAGRALIGSGTGRCTWTIPKAAKGKQLSVVVTVSYEGAAKSVPFVYRVS
jgi:hypothetical protein